MARALEMHDRQRLRWGVVGLGVGNQHALALLSDENAVLVAVCDKDPDKLDRMLAHYGQVVGYASVDEMLFASELDAVVVASYDWDHASTIASCLDRGIHVFAEKPLGVNFDEYRAIESALRRNERARMTTNTLLRRSPRFAWLKSEIDRGHFGKIVHVQADYLYGRLPKLTHGWRGTDPDYSVTLGGTIHMIDLLLWLVGERPESVTAVGSNAGVLAAAHDDGAIKFRGDSLRIALLSFASGLTASVSANFGSVGPHFHKLAVFGTKATFMNLPMAGLGAADTPRDVGLLLEGPDPGIARAVDASYSSVPKGILIPEFNQAILGLRPTPISEQEAMDAFAVGLAIDESVRTSRPHVIKYSALSPRD